MAADTSTSPPERRRRPQRRRALTGGGRRIADLYTHPNEYLTVQAFAVHLTVHERTVMKWIKAGALTAYQFDREWRIRKGDAVLFVERSRFRIANAPTTTSESSSTVGDQLPVPAARRP